MTVRLLKSQDIPILRAMFEASGFEYEFPDLESPQFETVQVVTDGNNEPLMCVAAKRTIELYLLRGDFEHPGSALHAVHLLHVSVANRLRLKGYDEANAFLPPQVERSFGKRLMRTFGWLKAWQCYFVRF